MRAQLLLISFAFALGAAAQQPTASTAAKKQATALPPGVQVLRDLQYGPAHQPSLRLDLYRPDNIAGPLPTVVFVHGGGWKNGSKNSVRKMLWLVQHGFAIASIDYRLTDSAQWPAQINDCYAAVRWVRDNAALYQLRPDKVGCWGTSAGAHLAALMGTRPCPDPETTSSRVDAVCDWFGPSELLTMPYNVVANGRTAEQVANSNGAKLLGAPVPSVPTLAKDASAIDHVSADDPPFLIIHGQDDPGVPPVQSQRLHDKLQTFGVSSKLILLPGAKHGGKEFFEDLPKNAVIHFFARNLAPTAP